MSARGSPKDGKRPFITVVTATYNLIRQGRADTFRQSIASVGAGRRANVEHLILDGGSTDGTLDMVREYERAGECVCFSEPDRGIYDAMNKGLRKARGAYVGFLNSDDHYYDAGSLDAAVRTLATTGADFAYGDTQVIHCDTGAPSHWWAGTLQGIPFGYFPCHQTMFVRTALLRDMGGFTTEFMANDNLVTLRLVADGRTDAHIEHPMAVFRTGGFSNAMLTEGRSLADEQIRHFHQYWGAAHGLGAEDCRLLSGYEYTRGPVPSEWSRIGARLGRPDWIEAFFRPLLTPAPDPASAPRSAPGGLSFRLFGVIPLFTLRPRAGGAP